MIGKHLAFSMVDHLRWDLKQILDLAVAEGVIPRIQFTCRLERCCLFVPRECPQPRSTCNDIEEAKTAFDVLDLRERVGRKLAVIAGMRCSEIFGLRRGRVKDDYVEIVERVCERDIDTPKTAKSIREAALSSGVQQI